MITLRNLQRSQQIDLPRLRKFAEKTFALCRKKLPNELSERVAVMFVSDRRMAELHQRFMQIAGPTDVLTFQHGEIFISVETAARNARSYRVSLEKELQLYVVHGLLHLCGFDDTTPAAARRMEKAQSRLVERARSD